MSTGHELTTLRKALDADGSAVLEGAGIAPSGNGMVTGRNVGMAFTDRLVAGVGLHRAWVRADTVMASAVPPSRPEREQGPDSS
jgi:catalase